jgi:C-terminal processing protease CtpA/Prc
MATHFHDSHGFMQAPVLQKHFGDASLPIRIRAIDGLPVVTGFTEADAATKAGFEIGDVIVKVDRQDASQRIQERLKYQAHSTPQSGMFYATERSLARGPKDSITNITVRDLHDQVRELKVQRKVEYMPKTQATAVAKFSEFCQATLAMPISTASQLRKSTRCLKSSKTVPSSSSTIVDILRAPPGRLPRA